MPSPAPIRVLIVDDNADAADTLAMLLQVHQFEVFTSYNGRDGLRLAQECEPDCIISDIKMPGLNGYEFARAIRGNSKLAHIKLVALSAFRDSDHFRLSNEAGFDYCLTKADEPTELLEILAMIDQIKELADQTQKLAKENVNLAGQTKTLIQDVKQDVKELKQDVKELKKEVKELKEQQAEQQS